MAGLVLGIESVPDGLASGLLAGVNPLAGLYAYLYGMVGATLFTSTAFMAVQGTGAMAIIVADVDLASRDDPAKSLFTLSIVTGVVMILAGVLHLGSFLRFVSNSVMTGFITAVGVNIVLGQLDNFTGYAAEGDNRVARAFDLLFNLGSIDVPTTVVGAVTVVLIVALQRTRLGALGMVVAIAVSSALAAVFAAFDYDVALVSDIADVPGTLPFITMPVLGEIPSLIIPAASLAFVGLVQGAGVAAAMPNEDGSPSDESADFIGQGAGNVVSGLFQGMPVGGSMSASSLTAAAGAKTRTSLLFAGATMVVVILLFSTVVEQIAMPALGGATDRGRCRHDQAVTGDRGRQDRRGAAHRDGDHLRPHPDHPAAVRRPRRRGHVRGAVRDQPVVPPRHEAHGHSRRRSRRGGRPTGRGPCGRGRRAPALRSDLLRLGAAAARADAHGDRDLAALGGDPEDARRRRRRVDDDRHARLLRRASWPRSTAS